MIETDCKNCKSIGCMKSPNYWGDLRGTVIFGQCETEKIDEYIKNKYGAE